MKLFEQIASMKLHGWCSVEKAQTLARAACGHYKQKVVFPIGAVEQHGGANWFLSCGINDAGVALVKITPQDLHL